MCWKSLRQQNLPVTIKYPEMVAQIAPHFEGGGYTAVWEKQFVVFVNVALMTMDF